MIVFFFFFSSRRRHTRCSRDWSSDVCSSDLREGRRRPPAGEVGAPARARARSARRGRGDGRALVLHRLVEGGAPPGLLSARPDGDFGGDDLVRAGTVPAPGGARPVAAVIGGAVFFGKALTIGGGATMLLYLVRHAQTASSAVDSFNGRGDLPLTDQGREQARKLGERLKSVRFAAVARSPLGRTKQTAELVASGAPHVIVEGLTEIDYG